MENATLKRDWKVNNRKGEVIELVMPLVLGTQECAYLPIPECIDQSDSKELNHFKHTITRACHYYLRRLPGFVFCRLIKVGNQYRITIKLNRHISSRERALYHLNNTEIHVQRHTLHEEKKIRLERSVKNDLIKALKAVMSK